MESLVPYEGLGFADITMIGHTQVTCLGEIHWIENGEIKAFSPDMIMRGRNAMTIRLIASDLDGTLYRDDKTISERTKNTLAKAAKRKICFVPVTGRFRSKYAGIQRRDHLKERR